MFDEELPPLKPAGFFEATVQVPYLKSAKWKTEIAKASYTLPDTSWLLGENKKSLIHLGWSEEGLYLFAHVKGSFNEPLYPSISDGDSLEVFIDTRGGEGFSYNTRFSHHFYFLPHAVDGHQKGEITHFRTEDLHPLADPSDIEFEASGSVKEGKIKAFLPVSILTGYDPEDYSKIAFSFRVNHFGGTPEHFSLPSIAFPLEKDPSLWTLCDLKRSIL